jgi:hypothetical protein
MTFKPKKDAIYSAAIWVIPVIPFLAFFGACLAGHFSLLSGIPFLLTLLLSLWLGNSTEYRIENRELAIKFWILRKRVKAADIISIAETRNLLSSYALSADRLEITCKWMDIFYISPLDAQAFIDALKAENPQIKIQHKLKP